MYSEDLLGCFLAVKKQHFLSDILSSNKYIIGWLDDFANFSEMKAHNYESQVAQVSSTMKNMTEITIILKC